MAKLYSAVEKGFYDTEIHANIPEDAVPISDNEYFALMQAQSAKDSALYPSLASSRSRIFRVPDPFSRRISRSPNNSSIKICRPANGCPAAQIPM